MRIQCCLNFSIQCLLKFKTLWHWFSSIDYNNDSFGCPLSQPITDKSFTEAANERSRGQGGPIREGQGEKAQLRVRSKADPLYWRLPEAQTDLTDGEELTVDLRTSKHRQLRLTMVCDHTVHSLIQWFSNLSSGTTYPACFRCFPAPTHLIQMNGSLSWSVEAC